MDWKNPTTTDASLESSRHYPSVVSSIATGQLDDVARLQQDGALGDHSEACVLAAANGHLAILQYLHRSGCSLQGIAQKALVLAAANGRLEVVRYLHENDCDIHADNEAAIRAAATKDQLAVLKYLHEQGTDLAACREIAEWLPDSPSSRPCVDYLASNGINRAGPLLSDLLQAVRAGTRQQVRANLELVDLGRNSAPLMRAAVQRGNLDGIVFLHQQGCDISAGNDLAFRTAAETGNVAVLEYLQKNGADIHANDDEAVRLAAENGHFHALVFLAEHGADLSRVSDDTLALARFNGHARVFDYLTHSGGLNAINLKEAAETRDPVISRVAQPAQAGFTGSAPDLPTVSILLANYNHAQYLPTALAGILGQTHPADEVLIVDDGSTDDSIAVITEFAARCPSTRLIRNGRNRGQHHSIQRALMEARGEFVVWTASDDLLLPPFLERSLRMLKEHPEAGLCFSRLSVFVDGTDEVRHFTGYTRDASFDYGSCPRHFSPRQLEEALRENYLWMSGNTIVARRAALLEMGGFERALRWHADWFAFYVVALRYGACVIPETLAMMRERKGTYSGGGISDPRQQNRVLATLLDLIKSPKYRDLLPVFRRRPSLLALFGKRGIYAALRNPRHWGIAWALIRWHGPRYLRAKYRQYRDRQAT